jgi:hypothetical protein
MICQEIKCKDYLTDEGDPAWCYRAGQPAQIAVLKCPNCDNAKGSDEKTMGENKHEEQII